MTRSVIVAAVLGLITTFARTGAERRVVLSSAHEDVITGRIAPNGAEFAFIAGDSIVVVNIASGAYRAVAGRVATEALQVRKQLVWSPDSRWLLLRYGAGPTANYAVVDVHSRVLVELFPDSLRGKLRTFGRWWTAPPVWSPDARRVAFLAGRPGEPGGVTAVWLADVAAGPDGQHMRPVVADAMEKTAVAWSHTSLAWASRDPSGKTTVAFGKIRQDTVEQGSSLTVGKAPITDLLWGPGDSLILATVQGGAPYLIDVETTLQQHQSNLPALAYAGWLNESELLAFRDPTPMTSEMVAVRVPDGRVRVLRAEEGLLSNAAIATNGRISYSRENGSQPRTYLTTRLDHTGTLRNTRPVLPRALNPHPDPWSSHVIRWNAADGTPLEAQLLRPIGRGRAPHGTIVAPYGNYRNSALAASYFFDAMLRQLLVDGWQILRPNTRGIASYPQSTGYGAMQLADTDLLLDTLKHRGLIVVGRIAIIGHSHGAGMAYYYATHSTSFCAAVAINGRADWVMQAQYDNDGVLPTAIGATPTEDPARYRKASPVANAGAVGAPMLIVAGEQDTQLLPANVRTMADSLTAYGKEFESIIFKEEAHRIEQPLNRVRLLDAVRRTLQKGCAG